MNAEPIVCTLRRNLAAKTLFLMMMTMGSIASAQTMNVWIGTGRSSLSKGIYLTQLNAEDGRLSDAKLVAEISGPGFIAKHPTKPMLYAVGALNGSDVLAAYAIEGSKESPSLRLASTAPIGDGGAAHVSLDKSGRTLFTAQYGSGSVAVFSTSEDGSVKARTQLVKHEGGSNAFPKRQESPHAHWTGTSPDNRYLFVPDLGLDAVVIYKFDATSGKIESHGQGKTPAGAGPRHMKFHPNGRWIYVLNELSLSVTVFEYDASNGTMSAKQTIPTVPSSLLEPELAKSCSEICVHPNGKFVYAANRGQDSITQFSIHPNSGELTEVTRVNIRAATPRNFNLTPNGDWAVVAGQLSNTLGLFAINPNQGTMLFQQVNVFAPTPICVVFD
jgi:6-phosphogluconolactonase